VYALSFVNMGRITSLFVATHSAAGEFNDRSH
jgi:hypothetical protein